MAEKIPFFTFFESFVPPRTLRLALHDAEVVSGTLDRQQRTMDLELEAKLSQEEQHAVAQLLR